MMRLQRPTAGVPLRIFSELLVEQQSLACHGFPGLSHFANHSIVFGFRYSRFLYAHGKGWWLSHKETHIYWEGGGMIVVT
jgi:hypothetical protein